jgi:hypothetical protein
MIRGFKKEQPRISRMTRMEEGAMAVIYEAESYAIIGCFLFNTKRQRFAKSRKELI